MGASVGISDRRAGATARSGQRTALAQAAMQALGPIVRLLLEIGVTSPEAESLLRALFIHQAREWLASERGLPRASDVRVALVTGVHRNFVRQILAVPPQIAPGRVKRGYLAGRLMDSWHLDPQYLDDQGSPLILPETGEPPSFAALVAAHLPGSAPTVVLRELHRAGAVELLAGYRVRVRRRAALPSRLTLERLRTYGQQARSLLATLTDHLLDPAGGTYVGSTQPISVDAKRISLVREIFERRATAFFAMVEQDLVAEGRRYRGRGPKRTISVSVLETGGLPERRKRRGRA